MPTFTNPNDPTDTYTTGKAGKPPKWVSIHPDFIKYKSEKELINKAPSIITPSKTGLRKWCWCFNDDEDKVQHSANCFVIANTDKEAIILLNKTFKNPVTMYEFKTHWKEIELLETDSIGVFELKDTVMTLRNNKI